MFSVIVGVSDGWAIGNNGGLPWPRAKGAADMEFFRTQTTGLNPDGSHRRVALIMGNNTRKSLPNGSHLPGRINIIVSRGHKQIIVENIHTRAPLVYVPTFQAAVEWCDFMKSSLDEVFVIGGAQIYAAAMKHPRLLRVIVSKVEGAYPADVYFPHKQLSEFNMRGPMEIANKSGTATVIIYSRTNFDEQEYLNLIGDILKNGVMKPNRSIYDALTVFGKTICVDLATSSPTCGDKTAEHVCTRILPLLTTKWVNVRAVIDELVWFMLGHANIDYLKQRKVAIWDVDTSEKSLQIRGLNYPVGCTGPIYGVQWRHAGGKITYNPDGTYTIDGGVDQLQNVVDQLIKNPYSRYHIVNSWNVQQIHLMALPPCHYSFEFMVEPRRVDGSSDGDNNAATVNVLNCMVHMRSTDVGLGLPFNLASYGLLTHIVSLITGYYPGKLMITMTDCHIYSNHIDKLREQINRTPMPFPTVSFSAALTTAATSAKIDDIVEVAMGDDSSITINDYMPHDRIILAFPELK